MNLPVLPEQPSRWLEAIKNPMLFSAFAILMAVLLLIFTSPSLERWYLLGGIAVVTFAINVAALIKPRFLAYGAREYLRESEMDHERRMAGKS